MHRDRTHTEGSTMRIAIIADIPGNLEALEAVLADIEKWSPDLLLVGGDMIFRGPDSVAVLERLQMIDCVMIRGNGEDLVINAPAEESPDESGVIKVARFTRTQIGDEWIKYLDKLPDHRYLSILGDNDVCIAHGIPGDCYRGVIWSDVREKQLLAEPQWLQRAVHPDELRQVLNDMSVDLFITAHIHRQFQRYIDGVTVANPGTVAGENFFCNGQLMAEYLICELSARSRIWSFIFRQVPFDVKRTISRLKILQKDCPALAWSVNFYERTA